MNQERAENHRITLSLIALLALLTGCGDEEILHGLEESQANQVLVALGEDGIQAVKRREEGTEAGWLVRVPESMATQARRTLAQRELPRSRPPGITEVFGKGRLVPSSAEERALYQLALSGELSRSLLSLDGVIDARVHLAIATPDPLRSDEQPTSRASVLVKCRPDAKTRLEALSGGIEALVAGAIEGLEPAAVSVVIADSLIDPVAPPPPAKSTTRPLLVGSASAAVLGGILALAGWWRRRSAP